jgi:hypothetical protein
LSLKIYSSGWGRSVVSASHAPQDKVCRVEVRHVWKGLIAAAALENDQSSSLIRQVQDADGLHFNAQEVFDQAKEEAMQALANRPLEQVAQALQTAVARLKHEFKESPLGSGPLSPADIFTASHAAQGLSAKDARLVAQVGAPAQILHDNLKTILMQAAPAQGALIRRYLKKTLGDAPLKSSRPALELILRYLEAKLTWCRSSKQCAARLYQVLTRHHAPLLITSGLAASLLRRK